MKNIKIIGLTRRFILSSIILSLPLHLQAEDNKGRLADGRAFRTDNDGNEIVDYMAELELQVESLNRRVNGLEDEVAQKQRLLESKGIAQNSPTIVERTLVGKDDRCPARECPDQVFNNLDASCNALKTSYEKRVKALENDLLGKQQEFVSSQDQINQARATCEQQLTQIQLSRDTQTKTLAEKDRQLSELKVALDQARASSSNVALSQTDSSSRARANTAEIATTDSNANRPSLWSQLWESDVSPTRNGANVVSQPLTTGQSQAKWRALQSLRGSLTTQLNQTRGLLSRRNSLYSNAKSSAGRVSYNLSQPVSSRNYSLAMIDNSIRTANAVHELTALSRDISEIQRKMNEDIELISRMRKVAGK